MDRKVLITGCRPGGTGEATAEEFAVGHRDHVLVCDREGELGRQAAEKIRKNGGHVYFVKADVSDPGQVERLMDETDRLWGRLDVLVNNCGDAKTPRNDNLHDLTLEEFEFILRANLATAFLVTKAAAGHFMLAQHGGVCIFLGSLNGAFGALGQFAYGIAKAGLVAMTKILAAQLRPQGIRCNLVQPGVIKTRSTNWIQREVKNRRWAEIEGRINPTGRVGKPADVAKAIAFLASDEAEFINGEVLTVDGGLRSSGILVPGFDPAGDFRESYVHTVGLLETLTTTARRVAA